MRTCTTHHHACDCREEEFKRKDELIKELVEAFERYMGDSICGHSYKEKAAKDVIKKIREVIKLNDY